jgi:regulatory protein YycI of two-component signal transduction system YycFG
MAKKTNWTPYIVVLIVLALLLLYVQMKDKRYDHSVTPIFNIEPEAITAVTIHKSGNEVTLLRGDSLWTFLEPDTGFVEDIKINNFIDFVVKGKKGTILTENPERHTHFNVDDSSATRIELKQGEAVLKSLLVGRSSSGYGNDNIRYPGEAAVWQSQEKLLSRLSEKASWWR